jgi:hypothetical protein
VRSSAWVSGGIGLGAWLLALAAQIIELPVWVGYVAFALGSGFLIVAGLWWYQGHYQGSSSNVSTSASEPTTGRSIAEYETTKRERAAQRRHAVVEQLHTPMPVRRTVSDEQARKAGDLLMQSEDLRPRLLTAIRDGKRAGVPWLPAKLKDDVLAWNERVIALADECMSIEDATQVATYPKLLRGIAGAGGQGLATMLDDNRVTLQALMARTRKRS